MRENADTKIPSACVAPKAIPALLKQLVNVYCRLEIPSRLTVKSLLGKEMVFVVEMGPEYEAHPP
jgi:hypothetical protein